MTQQTAQENSFTPPTAQQVRAHLDQYQPHGPSPIIAWLPILALAAALVLSAMFDSGWVVLLSCVIIAAVFAAMAIRIRHLRHLERRVSDIQALVILRQCVRSLRLAWRLLPSLVAMPGLHRQAVAMIAACLDQLKAYDAAIWAYDDLLKHIPPTDPASVQIQLQRTVAQLINGQLTDADDALRRLRGQIDVHPAVNATFRFAQLVQQVRTHHWTDAAAFASADLVDQLRPLGVEGGFGYGLVALACHRLAQDDPHYHHQALLWWSRATLLLPIGTLVDRFAELEQIARLLPADEAVPPPLIRRG